MLTKTKSLVVVLLLTLVFPLFLNAKVEIERKTNEKELVSEHIMNFKLVKRRSSWMYDLEIFNPDKNMITAKIYAKTADGKEIELAVKKFEKRGISKVFENKDYRALRAEIFLAGKKMDEKSFEIPEVKAEIVSFSVRGDRWFLKVRNKTPEAMEFDISIIEENTAGVKADVLSYETQNLDPEITHSRTASLGKLTIGNRLTLIVKDKVTKRTLAAKTITLK